MFFAPTHKNPEQATLWLTAGVILLISLGFIYTAFHHHHDFSAHPDCPICSLSGQAPVIALQANGPSAEQRPQPFFQEAPNRPPDPLLSTSTAPRAPPA